MKVTVAESAGFCFGVHRAVDEVYRQVEEKKGQKIYTFGPIIHNEEVVRDLEKKGVVIISEEEQLKQLTEGVIIIRSHGVSRKIEELMHDRKLDVVDVTCPFVKKIHQIVEAESRAGKQIVIAGNASHPEVQGIMGWCCTPAITIEDVKDLDKIIQKEGQEFCLVAQTTFNYKKFQLLVDLLEKKGYNIHVKNTICSATRVRQTEARKLAEESDVVLIVGGSNSSNTQKLYEICKTKCNNAHYIQTAADLKAEWFQSVDQVGITAGASTPNINIEEVVNNVGRFWTVIE